MAIENRDRGAVAKRSRLIELTGGKHIELSELVLNDVAFIEEECAADAKRNLILTYAKNADLLPDSQKEAAIMAAFKRAEEITASSLTSQEVAQFTSSLKGRVLCIWLSMRHALPNLTYDQASELWNDHRHLIHEASETVGEISAPTLGNASPPQTTAEAGANQVAT